jgi:hypothetical protein
VGKGGVGEVYKAIQKPLRRLVAVKTITALSADECRALSREATSTSRLHHPNVVTVFDAALEGPQPCIIMQYVDGISLRAWLNQTGGNPADRRGELPTSIVRQTALALREAHASGLVHRDVKPENILLSRRGDGFHVRLVDFGIARSANAADVRISGTAGYVSPEQLSGTPADPRADIFALGVVLYELVYGSHPFAGRNDTETFFNTVTKAPSVDGEPDAPLARVIRRALEKDPQRRYQTVDEFIVHLDAPLGRADRNPLLSEFPQAVQTWCATHSSGFTLAAISFLWGCVSVALSIASRAGCVRVVWAGLPGPRYETIYGYAVEPNAGLWYMFGASLFVLAGFLFLQAAHHGLARTSVLTDAGRGSAKPLERIADVNRRWFRFGTPAIIAFAFLLILVPEVVYRHQNALGWVQADLPAAYVGTSYDDLRRSGRIGEVAAIAACDACDVRIASVANSTDGFQQPGWLFDAFLLSALGHEVAFSCLVIWLAFKILFFFGLLSSAILGRARHGLRMVPNLFDKDDYRFGLGRLDNVYYAILLLTAIGAAAHYLQIVANIEKGTYFFSGNTAVALAGQAVAFLSVLILLGLIVLTPIGVFLFLTIRAVEEELGRLAGVRRRLEEQSASARSRDERERLQLEIAQLAERRDVARRQSLLPIRRPLFVALLATNVTLLFVLPLASSLSRPPGQTSSSVWQRAVSVVCAVCGNGR